MATGIRDKVAILGMGCTARRYSNAVASDLITLRTVFRLK